MSWRWTCTVCAETGSADTVEGTDAGSRHAATHMSAGRPFDLVPTIYVESIPDEPTVSATGSAEWCVDCRDCRPRQGVTNPPCGKIHDCPECASQRETDDRTALAKLLTGLTDEEWATATAEGTSHLAIYFETADKILAAGFRRAS